MKTDHVVELLERANPVRGDRLPAFDPDEVKASIVESRTPVRQPAPWRRRAFVAAGVAVVAAAGLILPRLAAHDRIGPSPAAAAVLQRAAERVTAYSQGRAGKYAYTKARTLYGAFDNDDPPWAALIPAVRETWVAADGTGRVREERGKPFFLGERDRRRWLAAGSPPLRGKPVYDAELRLYRRAPAALLASDPEELTPDQLDAVVTDVPELPTDPDALERVIRAYAATKDPPLESAMFVEISDLLNSPFGSAKLNAALYRVLSRVRGVELVGRRRDAAGRIGLAIGSPAGYGAFGRSYVIIDPRTGEVLASEKVLTGPSPEIDGRPGDVYESITYLDHGWTDSTGARPANAR
jgi:hypothetical protein